jgi:hypothetical protein
MHSSIERLLLKSKTPSAGYHKIPTGLLKSNKVACGPNRGRVVVSFSGPIGCCRLYGPGPQAPRKGGLRRQGTEHFPWFIEAA